MFCPAKYSYSRRLPGCFLSVEALELRGASPPRPPPGCCPWTPPGALKRAPGPPAVIGESYARFASQWGFFLKALITPLYNNQEIALMSLPTQNCTDYSGNLSSQCVNKLHIYGIYGLLITNAAEQHIFFLFYEFISQGSHSYFIVLCKKMKQSHFITHNIRPKKENCYIGVTGWTKIG